MQRKKDTYWNSGDAWSQSSGKLIPGCGHAGQMRASSPGFVPAIPVGLPCGATTALEQLQITPLPKHSELLRVTPGYFWPYPDLYPPSTRTRLAGTGFHTGHLFHTPGLPVPVPVAGNPGVYYYISTSI